MLKTKQLHHAFVAASDQEAAKNFYGRILGVQELPNPVGHVLGYGI